ncbi:hypothetical protein NZK35_02720 [Stieleria sp. ICT_E10.1]|uniref:hypothetical protein n=1 Tax=Stieleria sedimenti TaxID=2976331 RepID=UPI00217F4B53|nr:hypothetical protein [Stieleria sedimenti]MCS7465583.1 hypothetical protein [Stieleria sedimenti]
MTDEPVSATNATTPLPRRRRLRFSLLDLMLLTLMVAAWLPTYFAVREIPVLRNSVDQMRALTTNLSIIDDQKLCFRSLPGIWHNIHGWKYYLPADAEMELRLATEGIHSMGDPETFQSYELPTGVHTIHLKHSQNADQEYVTQVFVDDTEAIVKTHPPDWINTSGSSSNGKGAPTAEAFHLDKPLVLRQMRYAEVHPAGKFRLHSLPPEYDAKGNMLSIVPKGYQPETPQRFVTPHDGPFMHSWGHRQGMRLLNNANGWNGLLEIHPSYRAVLDGQNVRWLQVLNAISVRPVRAESSQAERPEVVFDSVGATADRPKLIVTDSLQSPNQARTPQASRRQGRISDDGNTMRLFVHYPAFPSGARLVLEVIFDARFPDRVGLRPHPGEGSVPLKAAQFVTTFDARFQWRTVELLAETDNDGPNSTRGEQLQPVALQSLSPEDALTTNWQTIPEARLPLAENLSDGEVFRRLALTTDVANFWNFNYPADVPATWRYQGLPIRQVWLIPHTEPATQTDSSPRPVTAEIRSGTVYPGTEIGIPGGPAVTKVRVTVSLPADKPIWMEIPTP